MSSIDFDKLGENQKMFERVDAGRAIMPGIPVLARLDGRGFHNFTKGLKRPYDEHLSDCMILTAGYLLEVSGAKIVYTQSDEITLCWLNAEDTETKLFFGGKFQKLCSILAAMASTRFNRHVRYQIPEKAEDDAVFDCRVWQVPSLKVAAENFLWREMDARKNSVSMAASMYFSPNELHGKSTKERITMLESKGVFWDKYPEFFKRGSYFKRTKKLMKLTDADMKSIPETHRPTEPIERTVMLEMNLPKATSLANLSDVLFFDAEPQLHSTISEAEM